MMRDSSWSGPSAAVATWIVFQLRGMSAMAALSAMARPESSSSESSTPVGGAMEMPARRLVGILGHEASVAVLSSGRCSLAGVGVPDG